MYRKELHTLTNHTPCYRAPDEIAFWPRGPRGCFTELPPCTGAFYAYVCILCIFRPHTLGSYIT